MITKIICIMILGSVGFISAQALVRMNKVFLKEAIHAQKFEMLDYKKFNHSLTD